MNEVIKCVLVFIMPMFVGAVCLCAFIAHSKGVL